MSFCILYNVVSENYSEHFFPAVWGGGSSSYDLMPFQLSLKQIFHFNTYVNFPCTDIILKLM